MMSPALMPKTTFVDSIFGKSFAASAMFVVAGAAFTAIAAQFVVPLYPVPATAQTLAVLVVGMMLGALRGMLSMLIYAALGAAGLPVFGGASGGIDVIAGPSGGYIAGFVLCAGITGSIAEQRWARNFWGTVAVGTIGTLSIYLPGLLWLAAVLNRQGVRSDLERVLDAGAGPFWVSAPLKILLAAGIMWMSRRGISRSVAAATAVAAGTTGVRN